MNIESSRHSSWSKSECHRIRTKIWGWELCTIQRSPRRLSYTEFPQMDGTAVLSTVEKEEITIWPCWSNDNRHVQSMTSRNTTTSYLLRNNIDAYLRTSCLVEEKKWLAMGWTAKIDACDVIKRLRGFVTAPRKMFRVAGSKNTTDGAPPKYLLPGYLLSPRVGCP